MEPSRAHPERTPVERSMVMLSDPFGGARGGHRARLFFTVMDASAEPSYLAERLGLRAPLVSKCLAELCAAGVVRKVRHGRAVFYTVGPAVSFGLHGTRVRVMIAAGPTALVTLVPDADGAALGLTGLAGALAGTYSGGSPNGHATQPAAGRVPTGDAPRATRLPSERGAW